MSSIKILFLNVFPANDSATYPVRQDGNTRFVIEQKYVAFSVGVPLNILVIYISLFNKKIEHNYKYLLANLAVCDILFLGALLLSNIIYLHIRSTSGNFTPFSCTLYAVPQYAAGACMISAICLISVNRYFVIVRDKSSLFEGKRMFLACLLVYIPVPLAYVVLTFAHSVYIVKDFLCPSSYWFWFARELLFLQILIHFIILIYSIVKLFRFLTKHLKVVRNSLQRSRLKDERSLIVAVTMQGLAPLLSCCPIVIVLFWGLLSDNSWSYMINEVRIGPIAIGPFIFNLSMTLLEWNPVFDALLTIFCVRQYRKIVVTWFYKAFRIQNRINAI